MFMVNYFNNLSMMMVEARTYSIWIYTLIGVPCTVFVILISDYIRAFVYCLLKADLNTIYFLRQGYEQSHHKPYHSANGTEHRAAYLHFTDIQHRYSKFEVIATPAHKCWGRLIWVGGQFQSISVSTIHSYCYLFVLWVNGQFKCFCIQNL